LFDRECFCTGEVVLEAGLQLWQAQVFVAGEQALKGFPVLALPGRFLSVLLLEGSESKIYEMLKAGIAGRRAFRRLGFSLSLFSILTSLLSGTMLDTVLAILLDTLLAGEVRQIGGTL
jgi:hypothetical protein